MEDLRTKLQTKELEARQFEDALRHATAEVKAVSAKLASRSPTEPGPSSLSKKSAAAGRELASGHPHAAGYPATSGYPSTAPAATPAKSTGAVRSKARSGQVREGGRGAEAEAGAEAGAGDPRPKRMGRSAEAVPAPIVHAESDASVGDRAAGSGPAKWTGGRQRGPAGPGEEAVRVRHGAAAGHAAEAQSALAARGKPAPAPVDQHAEEDLGTGASGEEDGEQWTESSVTSAQGAEPPPASYATSMADDDVDESDGSGSEAREESRLSEEDSLADARLEEEYDDNEGSIGPLETEESEDEMPALQK